MAEVILELGMGADVHGRDFTKAALRAVSDAIRHSSLTLFAFYADASRMEIEVTVGVSEPDRVDRQAVAAALPYGKVEVFVVRGGLDDVGMGGIDDIVLASAAVKVSLDTSNHGMRLLS